MADDDLTTGSPPMDGVVIAPQAAVSAQPPTADVDVLEPQDQAAAAREARETVARLPRQRAAPPKPASTEAKTVQPGQNPFDAFDGDPDDNGVALAERNRLNRQDAFYRGSLAGSIRLSSLANLYNTPDPDGITPEQRAVNKQMREEYETIVSDLAAYDQMPSFGTTTEALVSLGGQLEGTMISPESWVGWAAKGATWGVRTLRAGLQQGAISGAVDPAIQGLNIQAGVEQEYDPLRTAVAAATGLGIGATAHSLGEGLGHVVGQKMLRRQVADLAAEDAAFKNVRTAQELLNPESGVARPEPIGARESPEPESVSPTVREYEPGPVEGFDDVVKAERERLSNSYGAAQPKGQRLNEEARFSAFEREAGPDLDMVLEDHALRREDVGDLYDFYDRRPGENPKAALERAIDQWADARERAALQSLEMDSEWVREMDVLMTAMENEPPIGAGTYRTFRGEEIPLGEFPRLSPTREVQQEVPFRGASEETAAVGRSTESGGGTPSRQEAGDTGGREGAADGGGRGGVGTVAAEGPRGERLTERTAQGEQTLIPGVEPITDRQRAEAGMAKPMRGGDAPAGGLFDEGARNQQDLFLARRRSGSTLEGEQVRPADGIPQPEVPSPAADVAIRSLQQQSLDLAKALDFPLRQGRVGSRNAEGVFRPRSGVVRVREVPDFEVVAHEGAHALEAKMGPDLTALTKAFPDELARLDYDQGPTGRRVNEGFAEWMRLYMGNPAAMERQAPGFTTAFRAFMQERRPDLMQAIDGAAASYRAYLDAPSVDAVGAVRRSVDEEPRGFRKVISSLKEDGFGAVVKSVMQRSYDAVLDDKAPITRAVRELGRIIANQTGSPLDLKAADNPAVLMRMLARSRQAAVRDMMDGVRPYGEITPEGPALANAISEAIGAPSVWGKWDDARKGDFSKYLIARRAEYLWRKFDAGELANPPVAFSAADARVAMADMEAANPNFRNASDMVHGYTRELLRKQYEGGLITRDLYDKLLTEEFYVPFNRDMADKPAAGGGGAGAEGPGTTETVKRMRGSSRDIKDPLESLMMQTFLVNRTIRHNDIIKSFVDLARKAGPEGGKYVEPIPAHEARKYTVNIGELLENKAREIGMDPDDARVLVAAMGDISHEDPVMGSFFKMERASGRGEPIVFYKEGGELRAARFMSGTEGHALYEVLTAAPEVVTDLYKQVIGVGASVLRAGITTSPTFVVSNYIRDQFAAAILRSDYIPIISGLKGLKSEAQQGEAAVLYGYAGGVSGGAATGPVERAAERDLDALAKRGFRLQRTTSFKGLLELASFTEAGTRNSIFDTVFNTKKMQGLSDYEAMVEAAFQAQDLLDFSRHGSRTMAVRNMIPFLNATMQGLDKANRTMIEPIIDRVIRASRGEGPAFVQDTADFKNAVNAWVKAGALGGALGAVWAAVSWDREAYRDAPPRVKGTHLIVPWGDRYIVVPKPFELGLGFTFGEYAFQQMMTDDPRAARQFMEAAWEVLAPPNPLTHTPVITPTIELTLGKSLFTGRDIVPDQYKGLPDEMQYTDRTSELAKWLGKQTGLSPIKIEYGIGANFGTWGRDVAALSQGLNEDAPAASFDDAAFFRRFIKDPTRSSEVSTKFWEFMARSTGKFNQAVTAYDSLVKGFRDDQAREYLATLPDAQKAFVTLKSAANEDGKPAFSPDEKRMHPLQRAYDAVTLLNGIRKELATNTHTGFENGDLRKMDAVTRRDLLENIRELSQMELRNGLKIAGEPGYATRPLLDPNEVMERIRHISPEVAEEIARRYATSKIPKTAEVAKAWPQAQRELLRFGSEADIKGLSYDVKVAGPEFEGDKVKRPLKRRVPIVGSPAGAPNP